VDLTNAQLVEGTAQALFTQVAEQWDLSSSKYADTLGWAARLHEIGLTVSHSQFHKHGAYLINNSDLSGFSRQEQALLAALIQGHRRKFPLAIFETLPSNIREHARRLCLLLRLAVLLHRGRSASLEVEPQLTAGNKHLKLRFPPGWLDAHPLTQMELEQEAIQLGSAGIKLSVR
jgi:exopolyphosphatase/guanosine-5'-triphosphate,3'-diphosphate pyrophosphatase